VPFSATGSEDSEVDGGSGGTPVVGQQQRWIGLSRPIDGLSGLVDSLFIFLFFLNYLPWRANKRLH